MAEINIERKKRPVWPWILLIVLVALLIWGVYELTDADIDNDVETTPSTGMLMEPGDVQHLAHLNQENTIYLI